MAQIDGEIVINREIDAVFNFAADPRNEPLYNPRMLNSVKVNEGEIGAGSKFLAELSSTGRITPVLIEIVEYVPPRRYSSRTRLPGTDIEGSLSFDRVPGGTRMRWHWDVHPRGVFRLLSPLVSRMGAAQEERAWTSLKRYLEEPRNAEPGQRGSEDP